jgi:hypothetical protein
MTHFCGYQYEISPIFKASTQFVTNKLVLARMCTIKTIISGFFPSIFWSKVGGEHVDLAILDNNLQKPFQSSLQIVANCPQTKKIDEKVTTFLQKTKIFLSFKKQSFLVKKLNSICDKIFHPFFFFFPCWCGVKIHLKEPIINTNPWTIPNKCIMPCLTSLELNDTKFIESFKIN